VSDRDRLSLTETAEERIDSRQLWALALISFLIYTGLALLLIGGFHEDSVTELIDWGSSTADQLWIGLAAGTAAAGLIIWFSSRPPLSRVLEDFTIVRVLMKNRFSVTDRTLVSISAGVGEEFLFRGAIQPLLGIWATSFIFIAIHGYFKFKSTGHVLFAALMFGLSMMLGVLFEQAGLLSAMAAHTVYDLLLLWWADSRGRDSGMPDEPDGIPSGDRPDDGYFTG